MRKLRFLMPSYGVRMEETISVVPRASIQSEETRVDPLVLTITDAAGEQNPIFEDSLALSTFETAWERQDQIPEDPLVLGITEDQVSEDHHDLEGDQPELTVGDFPGVDLSIVAAHTEQAPVSDDPHSAEVSKKRSKKRISKENKRASKKRKVDEVWATSTAEDIAIGRVVDNKLAPKDGHNFYFSYNDKDKSIVENDATCEWVEDTQSAGRAFPSWAV